MPAERAFTRAVESPLIRGGLTIVAGVLTGNVTGFVRVAVIAYFLGTHTRADTLAVAMGPIDTLNGVLINSIVFAFVPMLAAAPEGERAAIFLRLVRFFSLLLGGLAALLAGGAPWLMRVLAPGLDPAYMPAAVNLLRIFGLSAFATGLGAVYSALLYMDRRFAPTAFYSAAINICTVVGALALWRAIGIYAFAIGYTAGSFLQLLIVYVATRRDLAGEIPAAKGPSVREILARPAFFAVYATGLGLNITFTRAWATHTGTGMAAAMDYCMRGVSVPLALLVNPISNSLLPEIARLKSLFRWRDAFRLIDRTIGLAALAAVAGCAFAILFRRPAIALLFERGSFTAQSTLLVSAVFLGLGPSMVGWSLIEVQARSLFALDRPWPPVIAAAIPIVFNVAFTLGFHSHRPEWIGVGATAGFLLGFGVLFALAHTGRKRWPMEHPPAAAGTADLVN